MYDSNNNQRMATVAAISDITTVIRNKNTSNHNNNDFVLYDSTAWSGSWATIAVNAPYIRHMTYDTSA